MNPPDFPYIPNTILVLSIKIRQINGNYAMFNLGKVYQWVTDKGYDPDRTLVTGSGSALQVSIPNPEYFDRVDYWEALRAKFYEDLKTYRKWKASQDSDTFRAAQRAKHMQQMKDKHNKLLAEIAALEAEIERNKEENGP